MAEVTKVPQASVDTSTGMMAAQVTGLRAGEALGAAAPCYIHSNGMVYQCVGAAEGPAADFAGMTPRACTAGEPITLYGLGARFRYGTGLTPGARLYIGATAGTLDTEPTVGDPHGIARVITPQDIVVIVNATNQVAEVS